MSLKKVHDDQPNDFKFSDENLKKAEEILKRYPEKNKKSAVMPFLYLAQKQNENWIPLAAMKYIAKFLEMPYIKVYEVATFYTMYNLSPVGNFFVQVCTTTPCMIRGANKLVEACKEKISKNESELSSDAWFYCAQMNSRKVTADFPVEKRAHTFCSTTVCSSKCPIISYCPITPYDQVPILARSSYSCS